MTTDIKTDRFTVILELAEKQELSSLADWGFHWLVLPKRSVHLFPGLVGQEDGSPPPPKKEV